MIAKIERESILNWRLNPTAFESINVESLIAYTRPLGSSVSAVNNMLSLDGEMGLNFPKILGVGATSPEFQSRLEHYWHSFSYDVPKEGKTLNTSLVLDTLDVKRKPQLDQLAAELKVKLTDKAGLAECAKAVSAMREEDKYAYAAPENIEQYYIWRFALVISTVANNPKDVTKSNNIKFYLTDKESLVQEAKSIQSRNRKALDIYFEIVKGGDDAITTFLFAAKEFTTILEYKKMDADDRSDKVRQMAVNSPEKIIAIHSDKQLKDVAYINMLETAGLILRLPNTSIFVDAEDKQVLLGNSIDEVILYFADVKNATYKNNIDLRLKKLLK